MLEPLRTGCWRITAKDQLDNKICYFHAPRVVLAAGTMNSIKILFASQEAGGIKPLHTLGSGFGTNGDCRGNWVPGHPYSESTKWSPIHGRLKTADHPAGVNLIIGGMDAFPMPGWIPDAVKRRLAQITGKQFQLIAMGADRADGSLSFEKGRLKLEYDLNGSEVYQAIFELFDRLAKRTDSDIKFDRKNTVTVHAMGGCRLGYSSAEGVVDGEGQVFGNAGLYIADASVLPAPTGGPPSLSIAAWSSHVASSLFQKI